MGAVFPLLHHVQLAEILVLYLLKTINFKVEAPGLTGNSRQLLEQQMRLNLDLCCSQIFQMFMIMLKLQCSTFSAFFSGRADWFNDLLIGLLEWSVLRNMLLRTARA